MKDQHIGIRIDKELVAQLKTLAEKDGRTLSNFIRFHLEKIVNDKIDNK